MASQLRPMTEDEIEIRLLSILASEPGGEAPIDRLGTAIRSQLSATSLDRLSTPRNEPEEYWESQIRKIIDHRRVPGSLIRDGFLAYRPGQVAITAQGRHYLAVRLGHSFRSRQ